MNREDIFYWLALQKVSGIGDISAKKLLRHFQSPKEIFEAAKRNAINVPDIGTYMISQLKNFDEFDRVEDELKFIEQNQIKITTIFDQDYPKKLFHAPDGPILFFSKGNFNVNNRKVISIVGTRNITAYGRRMVKEIVEGLKAYHPIIVSGLAYGVDIEAHLSALENDLETIGVLGHGFQRIYPAIHRKIADKMLQKGGLITEFWHTDIVDRNNFLKRNRIVAGMADAVIIIESGEKGGALVTAGIANSYNRDVFAVPGRISDVYSKGCNNLIKNNQAQLITSATDIVRFLNWDVQVRQPKNPQLNLFVDLSDDEQKIFDFLQYNGKTSLDDLSIHLQMPVSKIAQLLLQMELNNIINSLSGKYFELI